MESYFYKTIRIFTYIFIGILFVGIVNNLNIEHRYTNNKLFNTYIQKADIINNFVSRIQITDISAIFEDRKQRDKTEFIIIHHSAGESDLLNIDKYHKSKGFKNIAYTYFINSESKIFQLHDIKAVNPSAFAYNYNSVSICLQGNFDINQVHKSQYKALFKLCLKLKRIFPEAQIVGHNEIGHTNCPGKNLNIEKLKSKVNSFHYLNILNNGNRKY